MSGLGLKFLYGDQVSKRYTAIPEGTILGELRVETASGNTYKFVKASAAVAQYEACQTDHANDTAGNIVKKTAAVTDDLAGVAQDAFAANDYGWLLVSGTGTCKILTAGAAGELLAPTATAGVLGIGAAASVQMLRAKSMQAGGGSNDPKLIILYGHQGSV